MCCCEVAINQSANMAVVGEVCYVTIVSCNVVSAPGPRPVFIVENDSA